jgi:hypothetical protein
MHQNDKHSRVAFGRKSDTTLYMGDLTHEDFVAHRSSRSQTLYIDVRPGRTELPLIRRTCALVSAYTVKAISPSRPVLLLTRLSPQLVSGEHYCQTTVGQDYA